MFAHDLQQGHPVLVATRAFASDPSSVIQHKALHSHRVFFYEGAAETFKDAKPPIIISSFSLNLLRFYL